MTMTILSAAVIGEAVVLLAVLAVVAQLRARLARMSRVSNATVGQMSDLVREAQMLSAGLTAQIAEQASLCESLTEQVERAAPAPTRTATKKTAEPVAAARTRRKAASAEEQTPARSRARKTGAGAVEEAAPARDPRADIAAAREKGMDPIAIAVQRNLANKRPVLSA